MLEIYKLDLSVEKNGIRLTDAWSVNSDENTPQKTCALEEFNISE
jgi:hypothetical protein